MTAVTRPRGGEVRLALTGTAAVAVAFGFARYGYGLFVPTFREEFRLSTAAVGAVASATYVAYLVALLGAGALSSRWGPRLPVAVGLASAAVGSGLVAAAPATPVFVVGAVLAATSAGWCWAPFSDAVVLAVSAPARGRALAVISTGTTFGLVLAGPLALLVGGSGGWRWAWTAFAAAATATLVAALRVVPAAPLAAASAPAGAGGGRAGTRRSLLRRLSWTWRPGAASLWGQAVCYGAIASVWFTFAVDLVQQAGLGETWSPLLWTLAGAAGVVGLASGDAAARVGLGHCLSGCLVTLAASVALLAAVPSSPLGVAAAALLFGASYMPVAALLAMWSGAVYPDRPAAGFTVVLAVFAVGSVLAPVPFGLLGDARGLPAMFAALAVLAAVSAAVRPRAVDDRAATSGREHDDEPSSQPTLA